eukprot:3644544-Pyramimonas_sp.AAC.1
MRGQNCDRAPLREKERLHLVHLNNVRRRETSWPAANNLARRASKLVMPAGFRAAARPTRLPAPRSRSHVRKKLLAESPQDGAGSFPAARLQLGQRRPHL